MGQQTAAGMICLMSMATASVMKQETMCSTLYQPPIGAVPIPWSIGGKHGLISVIKRFAEKELDCRIDHRSYERQGIDQLPTIHEGVTVQAMEAKGIRTNKGDLNRWIKVTND